MRALLSAGDVVVHTAPAYQSLSEVARAIGCEVLPWFPRYSPSNPESTGIPPEVTFDVADLNRLLESTSQKKSAQRKVLIVMNMPHNPTGAMLSASQFNQGGHPTSSMPTNDTSQSISGNKACNASCTREHVQESVIDLCRRHQAYLFVDEMYRGLEHNGVPIGHFGRGALNAAQPHGAAQLPAACDVYERGISLSGLSKTLGLPGLRIGWVASQDERLLSRIAEIKDYISVCPPAPSEALAIIALTHQDALRRRALKLIHQNLVAVGQFIQRNSDVMSLVSQPRGGTFCLVRVHATQTGSVGFSATSYAAALRSRARLMLVPSSLFGLQDDSLRLTYGRSNTAALLERWSVELNKYGLYEIKGAMQK
eukprot:scaffold319015_cov35-Tisochrysis_lutea.AAC.2